MLNREWLIENKSKTEIIESIVYNCPYNVEECKHFHDIDYTCTECWGDWLAKEHDESEN